MLIIENIQSSLDLGKHTEAVTDVFRGFLGWPVSAVGFGGPLMSPMGPGQSPGGDQGQNSG